MNTDSNMQLSANYRQWPKGWEGHTRLRLSRCPLPPTELRPSTCESRPPKERLTITPVSVTQDQGACREKGPERQRPGWCAQYFAGGKWFQLMFDNEQQLFREMCRGHICMYRLATFEYFWVRPRRRWAACTSSGEMAHYCSSSAITAGTHN